jgi:ABC-type uncharacterized transport system fused permease/ATPase subunit
VLYFKYSKGGIKMKLKKEVKIAIVIGLIIVTLISMFSIILKNSQNAYNECLNKNNNNVNFCHRLIEG